MVLGACATPQAVPVADTTSATQPTSPVAERSGWRDVATAYDRDRIRGWYSAWKQALENANRNGYASKVIADGVLLKPEAALPNPHIPPGDYRCRTIKLGSKGGATLAYVAYPWFACRVTAEQNIFSFIKLSGSQRTSGLIFDDTDRRNIFLGTLILGDEQGARDYGADRARDMAGTVERIGANRWRIVFPSPAYESLVDVMEVTP